MSGKDVSKAGSKAVERFADELRSLTRASGTRASDVPRGRLIFAMDATASREPSWDRAIAVQSEMFAEADRMGGLSVQLVFYRGFGECKASRWTSTATDLIRLMTSVRCLAGRTQLARVLRQAIKENGKSRVNAMVLVTDSCEENVDELGELAGQLGLLGTPVFCFQEGSNSQASIALSSIARLTSGAHLYLKDNSADELRGLLRAVAAFASGGSPALQQLARGSHHARLLIEQKKV